VGFAGRRVGINQMTSIWAGEYLGTRYQIPDFTWISFSLTDAAFHEGGPHSAIAQAALVDTDARLGEVVAAIERRGVTEQTAIVVVADHGMEPDRPSIVRGTGGDACGAAGIPHRDEASGFLYLGDM